MKVCHVAVVGCVLAASVAGQETGTDAAARIRAGGWFYEQVKYHRGDDGVLQWWQFSQIDGPRVGEFVPLCDRDVLREENLGPLGLLALVCHGDADLLAMTDVDCHCRALGIGTADAELRQFLVVSQPSFAGPVGRAELLDRLLIVDHLVARNCRAAVAELTVLAANEALPAELRARAAAAIRTLRGEAGSATNGIARRRLRAEQLVLPATSDVQIVVDHACLPSLRWLTPFARRMVALLIAQSIEPISDRLSPAQSNGGQRMCDLASELPFWLVHRFGHARLDHSVVTLTLPSDPEQPVAWTWNAVGEFEHERWRPALVAGADGVFAKLHTGPLDITAASLFAATPGTEASVRPEVAQTLLVDDGITIRAVVPAASKVWANLAPLRLPAANGAELRVTFGDPTVIVLAVHAADDATAGAWVERTRELLAEAKAGTADLPESVRQNADAPALLAAFLGAKLSTKGDSAFAVVEVRGFTLAKLRGLAEPVAELLFPR